MIRRLWNWGWRLVRDIWFVLLRPSVHYSLGFLTIGGFLAGIVFWGGFNTALELTNTETFCISCHEMRDNVYAELQSTIHFTNRSGVRATCPDCHVPHKWTDKIARKMQASKEVWGKIFGTISTREKFLDKRRELAEHEWTRLKANDSLECRNCHDFEYMDFTRQNTRAASAHSTYLASGEKTCIDCHKGIAHQLPDMKGVPGWDATHAPYLETPNGSVADRVTRMARALRDLEPVVTE
ncbi:cytochrome c3 family protein [Dongia sp.]|uniref:cytochrome c3 family protein n=1 Tax=Dongia sp. TaxID=1977262 RepID=UPI0035AE3F62